MSFRVAIGTRRDAYWTHGNHITVNGVNTWYDERGEGNPVLLLHGGFGDSREFAGNLDMLVDRFRLYLPDRRGHGHTADVDGPITPSLMAEDDIVTLEHTIERYRSVQKGQSAIIPASSHLLLMEKSALIAGLVADFLAGPQAVTIMPVRRAK